MRARGPRSSTVLIACAVLVPAVLGAVLLAPPARGAVPHIFESVEPPAAMGDGADKTTILAQSFVATSNYRLLWLEVYAIDIGNPDVATIQVYPDVSGLPGGPFLASGQTQGGAQYGWLKATLAPQPLLVAGTRYWIEFLSLENPPNAYLWAKAVTNNYTAGWSAKYQGSAWTLQPTVDYLFQTWGVIGPSIAVGLAVDAATVGPGEPLRYTVSFDNIGTGVASAVWVNWTPSRSVTYVTDDASAYGGTVTALGWVFANVDVGPHGFHITVRTSDAVFEGLPITTSVVLAYAEGSVMQETSYASATAIARVPSLLIGASASPSFVTWGDNLSYTVSVSNVGSRSAKRVWLNDTLPPGVTYVSDTLGLLPNLTGSWRSGNVLHANLTDLPPGVITFRVNVTVNAGLANGTWLENWVNANYTDSADRMREPVTASAVARVHGASIRIAQTTVTPRVQPLEVVRFTIRLDNLGDANASHAWVNDTLSPGLSFDSDTASSLPSYVGGVCVAGSCAWEFSNITPGPRAFTLSVRVAPDLPDRLALANWANLSYTGANGILLDPSSSTILVHVSRPVLLLGATANQFANPGDTLGYFLRIDNRGSGIAVVMWLNVTFATGATYAADNASDVGGVRAGPGSWVFRNVTAGSVRIFLAVRLAPGLADQASLTNRFILDYVDEGGNSGARETVNASVAITSPVLSAQAFANRVTAERAMLVTYTLAITNRGSGVASDLWINDTIPDSTSFVRSSRQYISASGSVFTFHLVGITPGTTAMNITVRVEDTAVAGSTLRNQFHIEYTDANGNYIASNTTSIDVLVVASPVYPSLTLPLAVLLLGILVAVLVGFIGWKVYGVGSKDKPRIDELFLLHRSGELVRHLTRSLRPNVDSDALSGMLVAVQEFIKESFRFVQGSLEELKFGSHRIMLAHGKHLIVAAVVAGGHSERLAPVIMSGLDAIERDFAPVLTEWNGMPSTLDGVDRYLGEILKGKPMNGKATRAPRADA